LSQLKKLVSETAIYGLTHTVGRLLNFLLVPFYTGIFHPEEYGKINVFYSVAGFAIVVLLYGMETAFFNFTRKYNAKRVYSTGLISIGLSTLLFVPIAWGFSGNIARFLEYPDLVHFVHLFIVILAFDALSALPLALLRYQNRPLKFGWIRLTNIALNVGSNLLFLLLIPVLIDKGWTFSWYDESFGIGYIVLSNFIASGTMFLLLLPQWKYIKDGFDLNIWKQMMRYAYPLIFVGLAGIVNETLDRILLKKLLPDSVADFDIGVYTAFYKLSIIMTLFVQAFRFGAEPFFFRNSDSKNSQQIYATVMHYFFIVVTFIFLVTTVFLKFISPLVVRRTEFYDHPDALRIVPILLLANLFLGVLYNLNFWYKLSHKNHIGMWVSIAGALLTLVLNFILIPTIGIMGSAITTLVVYFLMCMTSYSLGQHYYPIPYRLKPMIIYLLLSMALVMGVAMVGTTENNTWEFVSASIAVICFVMVAWFIERPLKIT